MLVSRFVPQTNARKKIILATVEVEVVLAPTSFFGRLRGKHQRFRRYTGKDLDVRPFVGLSDQVLVDLKDHNLVNDGLFIAQVRGRVLACRAIKAHSVWLLSPDEYVKAGSLVGEFRILGRIRLIWKRV
jgi:hypothetical protein